MVIVAFSLSLITLSTLALVSKTLKGEQAALIKQILLD